MVKKYYMFVIVAFMLITSCKNENLDTYVDASRVYFAAYSSKDSLVHSLISAAGSTDTVWIKVNVLGRKLNKMGQLRLKVDQGQSTAVEGVHFEPLKEFYAIEEGRFSAEVPLVLIKNGPGLSDGYKSVHLQLEETSDFKLGYSDRLSARIYFTDEYVKPEYWESFLKNYYGEYSLVKHKRCVQIQKFDFPPKRSDIANNQIGLFMSYGRIVCQYYIDNIEYDENGNRIMPWAAF
ncbi:MULTISPECIES: DUF4843 domain-containing protein [Sphingobacterium]|uniref:DUF4843 domain-containing protein n=1 Tax=Sphingobacterium TaxID=28453 RepID=UPI0013DBC5D1|nr:MULTISPECIES: DUF4843 domain-containing protein [unclassified Sphingobacterium]